MCQDAVHCYRKENKAILQCRADADLLANGSLLMVDNLIVGYEVLKWEKRSRVRLVEQGRSTKEMPVFDTAPSLILVPRQDSLIFDYPKAKKYQ